MAVSVHDGVKQFQALVEEIDEPLKKTFQNVHQGYPKETLLRFLNARDMNVAKAHKMLVDCLNWRIQNEIDSILSKPIVPIDFYRSVRDSQLIGQSGYTKEGLPVIALGVGQSTYDKASANYYVQSHIQINEYRDRVVLPYATKKYGRYIGTCVKILDMTGLKLSALSQIKLLTVISTVDDLNYPEKTDTYYIVNVPYIFSSCWKIVKPLLQERTRRKVQVLQGSGKDELLKIMDYASLPHFCKKEGSGSSRHSSNNTTNCFSLDYEFHQQLYNYIKQQSLRLQPIIRRGSFHVSVPEPDPEGVVIAETIESEFNLEDLCLDFSLPGYPDYTLISNHNQQMVIMINLEEYVSFIVDATVRSGISRQVEALKSGFNQAGTIRKNGYIVIKGRPCKAYYPAEVKILDWATVPLCLN